MDDEDCDNGVDFKGGALEPHTQRDLVQNPALRDPVCHHCVKTQRSRDWGSLEVVGLSRGIVRDVGNRHVETGKASQAAQHEEGQEDMVQRCTHAEGESDTGGSQTKGDLQSSHVSMVMSRSRPQAVSRRATMAAVGPRPEKTRNKKTYQVGERVKLLSHHAALLAPSCDAAVHEVEE